LSRVRWSDCVHLIGVAPLVAVVVLLWRPAWGGVVALDLRYQLLSGTHGVMRVYEHHPGAVLPRVIVILGLALVGALLGVTPLRIEAHNQRRTGASAP
jgi:hypothetical protein